MSDYVIRGAHESTPFSTSRSSNVGVATMYLFKLINLSHMHRCETLSKKFQFD